MIRHVVIWKLKPSDPANKEKTLALLKDRLLGLQFAIAGIVDFEVGISETSGDGCGELALFSTFVSRTALESYIAHPLHQEVVSLLRNATATKLICDYPVGNNPKDTKQKEI